MMNSSSTFRRVFDIAAILAMLHLAGLIGLVSALIWNGTLSTETVRQIVMLMRGEDPIQDEIPESQQTGQVAVGEGKKKESAFVASQIVY